MHFVHVLVWTKIVKNPFGGLQDAARQPSFHPTPIRMTKDTLVGDFEILKPLHAMKHFGWSHERFVMELKKLVRLTLSEHPIEHEGGVDKWVQKHRDHPDMARLLFKNGELVGYWSGVFLGDDDFKKLMSGEMLDSDINMSALKKVGDKDVNFHIVMLGIKDKCRGFSALKVLISSIINFFKDCSNEGTVISNVCAVGYSFEGEALCIGFGMKKVCKNKVDDGNIYSMPFWPPPSELKILHGYREHVKKCQCEWAKNVETNFKFTKVR